MFKANGIGTNKLDYWKCVFKFIKSFLIKVKEKYTKGKKINGTNKCILWLNFLIM